MQFLTMFMDPVFLDLIMMTMMRKKSASFSLMSSSQGAEPVKSREHRGGVSRRTRKAELRTMLTR